MFVHTVFFWFNEDAPDTALDAVITDCHDYLGKVPTVRHLWAGRPAMTQRDVVDSSIAVGLTVVLDDKAGHDVYQAHDLHKQFIERNKQHWARVQVYDYVEPGGETYA